MKKYNVQAFFDLYYLRKMICGNKIGTVCGRTKTHIVLGLTDNSGINYSSIQFDEENFSTELYKSYCLVKPNPLFLIENWIQKQRKDTRNLGILLIIIAIVEILNFLF